MGTSTSNPGPTGRPPLLPPWAEPPVGPGDDTPPPREDLPETDHPNEAPPSHPPQQDPVVPPAEQTSWNSPRRLVSAVSSGRTGGGRGRDNVRRAVRRSVSALGGGRSAARTSVAGRHTAARFASFLNSVAREGFASAARTLGIAEFVGRSADLFLVRLADALAPSGGLTEDAIAREAMDATVEELYEQLNIGANGLNALERMTPGMMADAVILYVVNYIYARVIQALTAHVHATATSAAHIREVEQTARQYIEDAVRLDVDTTAFFGGANGGAFVARWDAGEGQRTIDRLFAESYRVVEAGLHHGDRRPR